MPHRHRILTILGAGLLALSLVGSAGAQSEPEDKQYWQDRYRGVLDDYARAEAAYEAAELRYKEGQRANRRGSGSKRTRGLEREEVKQAVPESAAALAGAKKALEEFPEEARQAGVPPGWIREVDDQRETARLEAERDASIERRAQESLGREPADESLAGEPADESMTGEPADEAPADRP